MGDLDSQFIDDFYRNGGAAPQEAPPAPVPVPQAPPNPLLRNLFVPMWVRQAMGDQTPTLGAGEALVNTMGLAGNLVQTALGGGSQERFQQNLQSGLDANRALQDERRAQPQTGLLNAPDWAREAPDDVLSRFAVDFLTDFSNWTGMGAWKQAGSLVPEGGALAKAFALLDNTDGAIQDLYRTAFATPGGIVKKGAEFLPAPNSKIIEGLDEAGNAIPGTAKNLREWAGGLSTESAHKQFAQKFGNAIDYLTKVKGHRLADDMSSIATVDGVGDISSVVDDLPEGMGAVLSRPIMESVVKHAKTVMADAQKFDDALRHAWTNKGLPAESFPDIRASFSDPFEGVGAVLDQMKIPHGEIRSAVDVKDALRGVIPDSEVTNLDALIHKWPAGDLIKDDPYELVQDRIIRERANLLGIKEPTGLKKAAADGMNWWKAQALISPNNLLQNATGGVFMGMLRGVDPFRVVQQLGANMERAIRNKPVVTARTDALAKAIGLVDGEGDAVLPAGVSARSAGLLGAISPTQQYTGKGQDVLQSIGSKKLAAGYGTGGALASQAGAPEDATPQERAALAVGGAAIGGGLGGAMPTISRYYRQIAAGMEDVMRQEAFSLGATKAVADRAGALPEIFQEALDAAKAPLDDVIAGARTEADAIRSQMDANSIRRAVSQNTPTPEPPRRQVSGRYSPDDPLGGTEIDFDSLEKLRPPGDSRPILDIWKELNPTLAAPSTDGQKMLFDELNQVDARAAGAQESLGRFADAPQAIEELSGAADELKGLISPAHLEDLLSSIGVPEQAVKRASQRWATEIEGAIEEGVALSNTIHFDYANLNNFEQLVKNVSPFATWSMKAFPFFAKSLAEHPGLLHGVVALQQESKRQREKENLTGRFEGAIHAEPLDALWSALLGRDTDVYVNPLKSLVPFADASRNLDMAEQEFEKNPVAAGYKFIQALGFSANPAIEFIARTSGLLGADAPASGLLRPAAAIQGATALAGVNRGRGINIDPSAPAETLIRNTANRAAGAPSVSDLDKNAVEKRLDELAIKETGKNTSSGDVAVADYARAKADGKGALWDRAAAEVSRERGVRGIAGFTGVPGNPQALLPPEEASARAAQQSNVLPKEAAEAIRELGKKSPDAIVPDDILAQVRAATDALLTDPDGTKHRPSAKIQAALDAPMAKNISWLAGQMFGYQADKNPSMQTYSGYGPPEARELANLLDQYRNLGGMLKHDPANKNLSSEDLAALTELGEVDRSLSPLAKRRTGAGGQASAAMKSRQDQFRKDNPILDQYLNWQQGRRGEGSQEEFIATEWTKRRR